MQKIRSKSSFLKYISIENERYLYFNVYTLLQIGQITYCNPFDASSIPMKLKKLGNS